MCIYGGVVGGRGGQEGKRERVEKEYMQPVRTSQQRTGEESCVMPKDCVYCKEKYQMFGTVRHDFYKSLINLNFWCYDICLW